MSAPTAAEATLVGAGAARALAGGGTGILVSVYRRASYVHMPAGLIALTEHSVPPGPIHVVLAGRLPRGLEPGAPVQSAGSHLEISGEPVVDLAPARRWVGELPAPDALVRHRDRMATLLAGAATASALHAPEWRGRLEAALGAVAVGDLATAAALLGGLGPGLTPAGDDALAGVLLVARARGGGGCEPPLVRLAQETRTTEISRAFLAWAALGQSLAPVHEFLAAGTTGDFTRAARAVLGIVGIGASSGSDLCLGAAAALSTLPDGARPTGRTRTISVS